MSEETKQVEEQREEVAQSEAPERGESLDQLPDDHPLVKTLQAQKEQIKKLKERAQRLDEIEQEQMSESEKSEARIRAAEERAAELESANARKDVAITYGLSPEDTELLDGVTDIDAMKRIAERLAKQAEKEAGPRTPKPHPAQRDGDTPAESQDAVARAFFGIN